VKTLELIQSGKLSVPMTASWYLSEIGRAMGVQELFTRQSPQRLKVLREHAIAQSVVSSNRIEGVEIDQKRVATVVFGHPALQDRDEIEVAGYRDALNLIHEKGKNLPISVETMLKLHGLTRGDIWDAGQFKDKPVDIIEKFPDGTQTIRFRSVSPENTPTYTQTLMLGWGDLVRERTISPIVLLAAVNLDFLCIHPFRDGNGRVSRLLLLLTAYHVGMDVGRYISLERIIEENKERYYETLRQSSQGWHDGKHDPWPYIGYLLFVFKTAYAEFEQRVGQIRDQRGAKTAMIEAVIQQQLGAFSLAELEASCPGVSRDMIRKILLDLQRAGKIRCIKRGRSASWERIG